LLPDNFIWLVDKNAVTVSKPELRSYSPNFQSSIDFIANYNHLQEQRATMLRLGAVCLAGHLAKAVFNPSHFITNESPA